MPAPSQPPMRRFGDQDQLRSNIYNETFNAVAALPPVENSRYRLELGDLGWAGPESYSAAEQKRAILEGRTLGRRVTGTWRLFDKGANAVVDTRRATVVNVPALTNMGTFILDGNAQTVSNQLRLDPGSYTRRMGSGQYENHMNFLPGRGNPHRIRLDPETGQFKVVVGQAEIPAATLLKALGASDDEIRAAWGKELADANLRAAKPHHLEKAYLKFGPPGQVPAEADAKARAIAERMSKYELDPWVTARTLGKAFRAYGKEPFLAATKKVLAVARGEAEPDDRDNPMYYSVWGPEHLMAERIARSGPVLAKALWQVTNAGSLKRLQPGLLTPSVRALFTKSGLAQCFDAQTKVLTARGFVDWPAVRPDDLFACRVNGMVEYHPGRLRVYDYDGKLLGCRTKRFDYLVTPEHRLFTTAAHGRDRRDYRFETAQDAYGKARAFLSAVGPRAECKVHVGDYVDVPPVASYRYRVQQPKLTVPVEVWAEFLGWYVAEGCTTTAKRRYSYKKKTTRRSWAVPGTKNAVYVCQSDTANPEKVRALRLLLDKLPFGWCYERNGKRFKTTHRRLAEFLFDCGRYAHNKRIPRYVFTWSDALLGRFFSAFLAGDGNFYAPDGSMKAEISSEGLAYDLAELAGYLGYTPRVRRVPARTKYCNVNQKTYTSRPTWVVTFGRRAESYVMSTATSRRVGSRDPYYQAPYSGKVYCATVPGGLLYVMRNGKPHWSGNSPEGVSASEFVDHGARITKVGEGGLGRSSQGVPMSARNVSAGQFPFIDPTRTSESENVGLDLRTSFGTRLGSDRRIYAPLTDVRSGRLVFRSPRDVADKVLAFPGELESGEPVVRVIKGGRLTFAPRGEVDYTVPSMEQSFSPLTNMVPMKSAAKAHRSSMGSRMISQSLSLVNPESPLVRSEVPGQPGKSFEELFGRHMGAAFSRPDSGGVVTKVTPDAITVRHDDGKSQDYELWNNHPSGRMTSYSSVPLVRAGQRVDPGQILARSNYTDDKGHAAYGANLRVAFMNDRGSVTKDTMILWYDDKRAPHYTPIEEVPQTATAGLALDVDKLVVTSCAVSRVWEHTADNVVEIKTESGRVLCATTNHSFVVLGDDLSVRETAGGDLRPGIDYIPRAGKIELPVTSTTVCIERTPRKTEITIPLDWDFGFVCGIYAAEGCLSANKASFAVADPILREALSQSLHRLIPGVRLRTCVTHQTLPSGKVGTSVTLIVGDVRLAIWLDTHCGHLAANKKVPDVIFGAPIDCRRGFIAGYWAGDGRVHVRKKGGCKDTDTLTTSRRLRDGLGLLLSSVGVSTTHGQYADERCTHGIIYRLGVSTRDAHLLPSFPHTDKYDRLRDVIMSYRDTGAADQIPLPAVAARTLYKRARERFSSHSSVYKRFQRRVNAATGRTSRGDVLLLTDEQEVDPVLRRLRLMALSPLEWDCVRSVNPVKYLDGVFDLDMGIYQTFVCVDTLVVHNSTYEDAITISQDAARRLSSDHLYQHHLPTDDDVITGKRAYAAAFPGKHPLGALRALDDDGVVKPGATVNSGDPLILGVRKKAALFGRLSRSAKSNFSDASEVWEHDEPGVVTDVLKTKSGPVVTVKTVKALKDADKVAGRFGNKGVVVVRPTEQMPLGEDGKPLEMLISSLAVTSRVNPASVFEAALGKIAAKTGRPYVLRDFQPGQNWGDFVRKELARNNVKYTETLTDPETGRPIPGVGVGNMYVMKLHHVAEKKAKGRGLGGYDESGQPLRGQAGRAMRMSLGDTNALLSSGATDVLRDAHIYRGQANEEFWTSFMAGFPPPRPTSSKAFDRFLAELRAAGVNPVRRDSRYHLMALTDKDVRQLAGDREVKNGETLDFARNGAPVPGGLFDEKVFGAPDSPNTWAKVPLHEPMLNPAFEEPARRLLGLTEAQFRDVIAGRRELPTGTGPGALGKALSAIDVEKELARTREQAASSRKTARDEANRRLVYLKGLQKTGQSPADWVLHAVPVLPPLYRPVSAGGPRGTVISHDSNAVYKDLIEANHALRDLSKETADVGDERLNLYDALKAVVGLGDPVNAKNRERGVRGILSRLLGDSAKTSYMQQRLLGTAVDLSGRATALPDPDLDMDQVGVPEPVAWEIYHPFVVRRLVRDGMPRVEAVRQVTDRSPVAKNAMLKEMDARPVLMNRYPILHRYGHQAFRPVLTAGHAVRVNHMVTRSYGGDYDGDAYSLHVPLTDDAVREAYEKLLPSKNLLSPATMRATNFNLTAEYAQGAHAASTADEHNPPVTFRTKAEAIKAYKSGEIPIGARVRILEPGS